MKIVESGASPRALTYLDLEAGEVFRFAGDDEKDGMCLRVGQGYVYITTAMGFWNDYRSEPVVHYPHPTLDLGDPA